jgi:hypothetical protein
MTSSESQSATGPRNPRTADIRRTSMPHRHRVVVAALTALLSYAFALTPAVAAPAKPTATYSVSNGMIVVRVTNLPPVNKKCSINIDEQGGPFGLGGSSAGSPLGSAAGPLIPARGHNKSVTTRKTTVTYSYRAPARPWTAAYLVLVTCFIKENAGQYRDFDAIQLPDDGSYKYVYVTPFGWGS